jgi:WD40 repeat protein
LVCLWPTGDELPTAPPFVLSHQQRPNGLACTARFSPNGRWLATFQAESNASELVRKALSGVFGPLPDEAEQRGVVLWDLAAADPTVAPRELPESRRQAICLAFDADGGRAAAGCMDGSVRIWSLGPDRPVKEPLKIQHVNPGVLGGKGIEDLAFSADRRFLLTAGMKDTRLWEFRPANGVEPAEDTPADDRPDAAPRLFGVYAAASRVLFGPQGRWFATSLDEGRSVRLYDLKLLEAIEDPEQVEMGEAGVALVNVEDEPVLVAVTHHDEQAELGTTVLRGHEGEVLAMATDAGGRRLVTSGADGTLRIWDLGRRTPFAIPRTLPRDERTPALPWAVAGKGGWLAAWPDNREDEQTVCLWNTETAAPVLGGTTTLKDAAAGADKAVLSNDGRWLAITAQEQGQPPPYSGVIRLYDLRSAQTPLAPRRLEIAAEQLVETLVLDPSDRWLAAAWGHPAVVRVWDLHADDPAQTHFDLTPHAGSVPMIAFTADGRRALTGCSDGVPRLWDLGAAQPGKTMTTLQAQEDEITAAAIRADGRYVAVGSKDGRLQLWALASGGRPAPPTMLHQFAVEVRCAAFSNDGRWLAAGAGEEPPRLWNLSAEKIAESARALPHPDASIEVVAFSPDGRWLVTGGARAIPAMVWDLTATDPSTTGIRLFRNWLPGELVVSQAVFLPRSPWLMTIGYDLVRLWPLEADELIGLARATAGRSLASDELQPAKESAPAPQATAKATPNATPP